MHGIDVDQSVGGHRSEVPAGGIVYATNVLPVIERSAKQLYTCIRGRSTTRCQITARQHKNMQKDAKQINIMTCITITYRFTFRGFYQTLLSQVHLSEEGEVIFHCRYRVLVSVT